MPHDSVELVDSSLTDALLLGALPMPVLIVTTEGRYTFANDAACDLLGRPLGEVIGLTVRDITAVDDSLGAAWSSFINEQQQEGEFTLVRPDGAVLPVRFHATRDFGPGRHMFVLTDMTERRRIDELVRRNEHLFLSAFASSPAPTNVVNLTTGNFVEANDAFLKATGYWRSEIVGRAARALRLWKNRQEFDDILKRLADGELIESTRADVMTKDRSAKSFMVAFRRVTIHDEPHVVAVYSDIDED